MHEEAPEIDDLTRLDEFGQSLARTRSDAIAGRETSGIEDIWREDEEFYEGVDDENRGDERTMWGQKPPGQAAPRKDRSTRSRVFPNVTGPFTDAAAARIADMLLPTDDRAWGLKPTPIPDLVQAAEANVTPELEESTVAKAMAEANRLIEDAKNKADKAQKRIEDWHVECQYHAEVREVIEDGARMGVGVLKGPIPTRKRRIAYKDGDLHIAFDLSPGSKRVDPWNCYPDPACGEKIHNGSYFWERDYLTRKQLRDLIGQEDYIEKQILECLKEGPQKATAEYSEQTNPVDDPQMKDLFEVWYFHGTAEREDLEAAGCDCDDMEDPHVPAVVTMVNNRVIKAALNPLDTGDYPYDVFVWRKRKSHWAGIGVPRQIRTAQKIVTAGTRNLMDNAGLAAGPILIFLQGVISSDEDNTIRPRKVYYVTEDAAEIDDARKAIGSIKVDMLVPELMQIIELGLKLAEYVTGLPMILQGQMGRAPDTVGGMTMLENNASSVLRRLARTFDDRITEPHIRRYYVWLLQYGEDDEKGDFVIDARGSSALVERDIQNQELTQFGAMVVDPRFGLDPKKWMSEYLKSRHFDPKRFEFEDEKWQKVVEQMAQGPQDNSMAVAEMKLQAEQFKAQMDERIQQAELAFKAQEGDKDRQMEQVFKQVDSEIELMKLAGQKEISLDNIKAMLAKTAMTLREQKKISDERNVAQQVAKPAAEPPGRAPPGEAFQR